MKSLLSLMLFIISLSLSACRTSDAYDIEGNAINFNQLKGQWLLIAYWAEWCPSCLHEIKILNQLQTAHQEQLQVLAYHVDGLSLDKLKSFKHKYHFKFPLLQSDPAQTLNYPKPMNIPYLVLINPQGQVHQVLSGSQSLEQLTRSIEGKA